MLLTVASTHKPAQDLGYLFHKNPSAAQTFDLSFGQAHVFYPEVSDERCEIALLLEVDPIRLSRRENANAAASGELEPYVNDRPYVCSSFMSVAIAQIFGSALGGKSKERPKLAEMEIPLVATLSVVPCRGNAKILHDLFEPLGYTLEVTSHVLDEKSSDWGDSRYYTVTLNGTKRVKDLLGHIYVLIPVLDNEKHYFVGDAEVEKLLKHAKEWLKDHPAREMITRRYLRNKRRLADEALARLVDTPIEEAAELESKQAATEEALEKRISLNEHRINAVTEALKSSGASRVIDLGCGEGKLMQRLAKENFHQISGMDVSSRALEVAEERLHLDRVPDHKKDRVKLLHGSLCYRDKRLEGFDAATCVEVIEHLDEPRLTALEKVVFRYAKPKLVVVTTPNVEYNQLFETLPAGEFRHKDHRFEWTREQFQTWATMVATRYGYNVAFQPIGEEHESFGPPTQMGVFSR